MNRIGLKWTELKENGPKCNKVDPMDQIGSHKPKWTDQAELN